MTLHFFIFFSFMVSLTF